MKATCGDTKQPEVALNTTSATLANLNPNTKTNKRTIYMCWVTVNVNADCMLLVNMVEVDEWNMAHCCSQTTDTWLRY
jgi:5-keto 4-deoxyuronate isomerase